MVAAQIETEPRWLVAGPPYEFTRGELLELMQIMGLPMTESRLRYWADQRLLPAPSRRTVPPGATDGIVRALYPVWTIGLLSVLHERSRRNETIAQLQAAIPALLEEMESWAARGDGLDLLMKHQLIALEDDRPIARRKGESWPVATLTPIQPRITRALQRAAWESAEDYAARSSMNPPLRVVLLILDEDGKRITTVIPPPPSGHRVQEERD